MKIKMKYVTLETILLAATRLIISNEKNNYILHDSL